jgi:hypothetical protein
MGEGGRDEPGAVYLGDALRPAAGVRGVLLEPADRVGDGVLVGLRDQLRYLARRDLPQRRHALDGAKGEVVAGDRDGRGP